MQATATFAASSLVCRRAAPSITLATSRDLGWTSILADHNRVDPGFDAFETEPTPDQTIVMMTRGEQDIECFSAGVWRRAVYRTGTIGMTPGGETDRLRRRRRPNSAPFEKINLYIPQDFLREAADHYRGCGHAWHDRPLRVLAFNDTAVAETLLSLLHAITAGAPELYAQAAIHWLCVHLLAVHGAWPEMQEGWRQAGLISDRRLARVLDYMSTHFAEPLRLEHLAEEAGVSKFHFSRLFRARTGHSPCAFLLRLRMDAARKMLAATELSVAEVACRCGFARPAHFGTAFTKRFNVSPTAFRSRARRGSGLIDPWA